MPIDRTAFNLLVDETTPGSNDGSIVDKALIEDVLLDPIDAAIAAAGGGAAYRCAAYSNVLQSIPDATFTAVLFELEDYDVGTLHSIATLTSRFVIPTGGDGAYLVAAVVGFAAHATGQRIVTIRKNGADIPGNGYILGNAGGTWITGMAFSMVLPLVAGDYVELVVYQNSGAPLNIGTNIGTAYVQTRCQVARIGA